MNERVLLIDDHTLFRAGLRDLLLRRNIEVVADVADGTEGVKIASENPLDIVLLDMRMPLMDGISVLKILKDAHPDLPVAMLTTSTDESDLIGALQSGAQGYLLKDMEPDDLVVALREIVTGKTVVAPGLETVLTHAVKGDNLCSNNAEKYDPFAVLTPREFEVVTLIAEGQSNKVIARNLYISDGTVKLHVKSILKKLNVNSRITIAVMAVEYGVKKTPITMPPKRE